MRPCTRRLLHHLTPVIAARGHEVTTLDARSLPAEALLSADTAHPDISAAVDLFERADAVLIGTPIYKAAYSGLLKSLLDLLPQRALAGRTVLPLATGGSPAHVLAIDYALRPVLSSLGAAHITPGWFVLDRHIGTGPDGSVLVDPASADGLRRSLDAFLAATGTRSHATP